MCFKEKIVIYFIKDIWIDPSSIISSMIDPLIQMCVFCVCARVCVGLWWGVKTGQMSVADSYDMMIG